MNQTNLNNSSGRLISLDAFRGITIAAMILVNFPGNGDNVYAPLNHTHWNGITPTDLIAPFFLFIVGVAIAFAYTKRLDAGIAPSKMYPKLVWRSLKIFAVGMFLNILGLLPDLNFADIRYTGTLHRIAIVFLVCGFIFLNTNWKTQAIIAAVILVGYWLAMNFIPTPGYGQVMLERDINLAQWIDSKYMPGRLYQKTWDPEGILSTFPSIVTGYNRYAGRNIASEIEITGIQGDLAVSSGISVNNSRSCMELAFPLKRKYLDKLICSFYLRPRFNDSCCFNICR